MHGSAPLSGAVQNAENHIAAVVKLLTEEIELNVEKIPVMGQSQSVRLQHGYDSITKGRVGVDRRKGLEQRIYERRNNGPRSLLTQEEIDALLS